MKTSFIIPFKDEKEYALKTMSTCHEFLSRHQLSFELIAVDDSTDGTWEILRQFEERHDNVVAIKGGEPNGYGTALKKGITVASGDILIPFNGDLSDSLEHALSYIQLIEEQGYKMVFGSRYMKGSKVYDANPLKQILSKWGNYFLKTLYQTKCTDITNSFKAYKREVIEQVKPESTGYNIVMEIALKAILQNHNHTTIPVSWTNREFGQSKMSLLSSIPRYLSTAIKLRF